MLARIPLRADKGDLLRVSAANKGWRVELQPDGELTLAPPTGGASGRRNSRLSALVETWAQANDHVAFDSSAGFAFPNGAVLSPDAALVARDRWESLTDEQREDFVPLVPEIVIELVSKSDRPADLREKLHRFREAGTAFVVLIDPYRHEMWTDGEPPAHFDVDLRTLLSLK